jgi:hypothetical protein
MCGMEITNSISELLIAGVVVGSLSMMAMIFALLLAQLMYGLFEG